MPADDESDTPRGESSLLDLGESLLNAVGDGTSGTEWREEVERTLGGEGEIDYDRIATAGIAAGEQVSRLREQARNTPAAAQRHQDDSLPPIEVRDIYDTHGEYAGTRLYVSAPDADAYLSADGSEAVIRAGTTGETVSLPQPATAIKTDDEPLGGMVLFIAYPDGSVLDAEPDDGQDVEPDADLDDAPADGDMKWVDETRLDEGTDE